MLQFTIGFVDMKTEEIVSILDIEVDLEIDVVNHAIDELDILKEVYHDPIQAVFLPPLSETLAEQVFQSTSTTCH